MRHSQAVEETRNDPDICPECGGWLGRKSGTKPFCRAKNCPGRFAPMSPAKNAPSSVLASKSPARSPAPAKFAARSLDDAEEARIKKSNAKAAAAAAPSSGAGGGGALKALMFTLGTAALGGAWYYALVLNDPDAPMDVLGLTIETREDRVLIMIAVTFLFIC
jgi:hypothetical protein